jgi:rare lipoprotein A (peptidoglycan hydrolase)
MNAMTAAHKTLPMGSQVRVTNLANRRAVVLLINDRGPFARGRIIDVSKRAADELGFRRAGTAEVRVQVVSGVRPDRRAQVKQAQAEPSDAEHFLPVLNKAMEHGGRLSAFSWTNPEGSSRGSIVVLTQPRETNGPLCRNYRRTAERGSEQAVYIGRACRNGDGSWRIVRERRKG